MQCRVTPDKIKVNISFVVGVWCVVKMFGFVITCFGGSVSLRGTLGKHLLVKLRAGQLFLSKFEG